jgi:hypothetical protein
MSGASSRRKGHDFERSMAKKFRAAMPGATVRRGLQQSRDGAEVADVDCPVYWVECKKGKQPNIRGALRQAEAAAPKGLIPIAVVGDDRQEPTVTLRLSDFLEITEAMWRELQR